MKPKHSKTKKFVQEGLFCDLQNFAQLENRISLLPEHERGDGFEVFAEAYFATQKKHQAEEVWPHREIPISLRHSLGLSDRDMGVDGVLRTKEGHYHSYQVKFRSNRERLSWETLSTFMGLSDQVHNKILFTNSCDLPDLMQNRTRFYAIKGNDLDNLREEDFRCIEEWLKSGSIVRPRRHPYPHQIEALEKIENAIQSEKRTTVVMPCATGKTLISLWLAEKMDVNSVLVLAPSLQLIKQILHEWTQETIWEDYSFLCVCSDKSVVDDIDEIVLSQTDLDFPVTTSSNDVFSFLKSESTKKKIIFSTYHSSHVVGQGLPPNFSFDLGIFDEAHKTAGRAGTKFSFALSDENLSIQRRVFFTATPRHYDIRKKDKEGDLSLVFSMDNSEVYGSVSHSLSFAAAASRGIICPYKIIISVTTDEDVTRDLLKRGEVIIKGDTMRADMVAQFVAVQNAVEKYNVRKIFTFHSTVKAARSFCHNSGGLLGLDLYHVHGEMSTSKRESILREFKQADKALVSNARCLTEGVDVPAVDMVAFVSPKKSRVDIVQAAGRVMRKAPDKKHGYLFIPIHLETTKGESIESAVKSTGFEHVWEILEAMCEHDEILSEIIQQMREDKGRTGSFDDLRLNERLEVIGPELGLEHLRRVIGTSIVDNLGSNWDEKFGELVKFRETEKISAPWKDPIDNKPLYNWARNQRTYYKKNILSPDRVLKLEKIGFAWHILDQNWSYGFSVLEKYVEKHGHAQPPFRFTFEDFALATWVTTQRMAYFEERLSKDKIDKLESLPGWSWNVFEDRNKQGFAALDSFVEREGHALVPSDHIENGFKLGRWVSIKRQAHQNPKSKHSLTEEDRKKLESYPWWFWNGEDGRWERGKYFLMKFCAREGHTRVKISHVEEGFDLGRWIGMWRYQYKKKTLPKCKIDFFESLPQWSWDVKTDQWDVGLSIMKQYVQREGHAKVPSNHLEGNFTLGTWTSTQKYAYSKGKLSQEKIDILESLPGWSWNKLDAQWEHGYECLKKYVKIHGHSRVPSRCVLDEFELGTWVSTQRYAFKRGSLPSERIELLELVFGWTWNEKCDRWEIAYSLLVAFLGREGHACVPYNHVEGDFPLGEWVQTQRKAQRNGKLTDERKEKLEKLSGWTWNTRD